MHFCAKSTVRSYAVSCAVRMCRVEGRQTDSLWLFHYPITAAALTVYMYTLHLSRISWRFSTLLVVEHLLICSFGFRFTFFCFVFPFEFKLFHYSERREKYATVCIIFMRYVIAHVWGARTWKHSLELIINFCAANEANAAWRKTQPRTHMTVDGR